LDVVEADQVRSLDYQARRAEFIARAPEEVVRSVVTRIRLLLE
jgi:mRNA interferase MazF